MNWLVKRFLMGKKRLLDVKIRVKMYTWHRELQSIMVRRRRLDVSTRHRSMKRKRFKRYLRYSAAILPIVMFPNMQLARQTIAQYVLYSSIQCLHFLSLSLSLANRFARVEFMRIGISPRIMRGVT